MKNPNKFKKKLLNLCPLLIIIIFWLIIFEIFSNLWINYFGTAKDKTISILQKDPFLGWKQKSNYRGKFLNLPLSLNTFGLRNKEFKELNDSSKKVLVLGPSSSFGWGVDLEDTFSFNLEKALNDTFSDIKFDVINASQIGFSSWQGLIFAKKFLSKEIHPDIVIISYGINDLDRFRFFFHDNNSDHISLEKSKVGWQVALFNNLNSLNFIYLFRTGIHSLYSWFKCYVTSENNPLPSLRVSPDNYLKNILSIKKTFPSSKFIIMTTTMYTKDIPSPLTSINKENSQQFFNQGIISFKQNRYNQSLISFKKSIDLDPDNSNSYFYLNAIYYKLKKYIKSREAYFLARKLETKRIYTDLKVLNNKIRDFASNHNILLADIENLSKEKKFFVDPIHFSPEGHNLITNSLLSLIVEKNFFYD